MGFSSIAPFLLERTSSLQFHGPCMNKKIAQIFYLNLLFSCVDAMPDTNILNNEKNLFAYLLCFLHERKSPLRLCYRASLHGWQSQKFHQYCDGKAGTVVLVKVGNWIFGGYTDQTWNGGERRRMSKNSLFL